MSLDSNALEIRLKMNKKFKLKKDRALIAFLQNYFLILNEILMETNSTYFKIIKEYFQSSSTFLVNSQLPMTSAKTWAVGYPPPTTAVGQVPMHVSNFKNLISLIKSSGILCISKMIWGSRSYTVSTLKLFVKTRFTRMWKTKIFPLAQSYWPWLSPWIKNLRIFFPIKKRI